MPYKYNSWEELINAYRNKEVPAHIPVIFSYDSVRAFSSGDKIEGDLIFYRDRFYDEEFEEILQSHGILTLRTSSKGKPDLPTIGSIKGLREAYHTGKLTPKDILRLHEAGGYVDIVTPSG